MCITNVTITLVSTVGLDEDMSKRYVKYQEHHE